jgi:hypothetical protein
VRVVGATAIASAALVLIDNTVVGWVHSPTYAAPMKEVLAFHAHHSAEVAIAVGLEALNVPLLLLFFSGLHGLVGRRGGAGADWSRLATRTAATTSRPRSPRPVSRCHSFLTQSTCSKTPARNPMAGC